MANQAARLSKRYRISFNHMTRFFGETVQLLGHGELTRQFRR
jgi:hypothetical protein